MRNLVITKLLCLLRTISRWLIQLDIRTRSLFDQCDRSVLLCSRQSNSFSLEVFTRYIDILGTIRCIGAAKIDVSNDEGHAVLDLAVLFVLKIIAPRSVANMWQSCLIQDVFASTLSPYLTPTNFTHLRSRPHHRHTPIPSLLSTVLNRSGLGIENRKRHLDIEVGTEFGVVEGWLLRGDGWG